MNIFKSLIVLMGLILIISACGTAEEGTAGGAAEAGNNELNEEIEQEENEEKNEEDEKEDNGVDVDLLEEESRYALELKNDSFLFIYAEDEEEKQLEEDSSADEKGDTYFEGNYEFVLLKSGENSGNILGGRFLTFFDGEEMVYTVNEENNDDLIVINQKEENGKYLVELMAVEEGVLKEISTGDDSIVSYDGKFKYVEEDIYQTAVYKEGSEQQNGWLFNTWEVDRSSLSIKLKDQKLYNNETYYEGLEFGRELYESWVNDPEEYFPYAFIPVDEQWLTLGAEGRLPTVSHPLGTSYEALVEEKGEPSEISDWFGGAETYVYGASAYLFPYIYSGEREFTNMLIFSDYIDGDVDDIYEVFGEPDVEYADPMYDNTYIMEYRTGAYQLIVETHDDELFYIMLTESAEEAGVEEREDVEGASENGSDGESSSNGNSDDSSNQWQGEWDVLGEGINGYLKIYNEDDTGFDFELHVATTHVAGIEGYAAKDGNTATHLPGEVDCFMTFEKDGNQITAKEGEGCWQYSGAAIDMNRTFIRP
ncbi:hypothetical protein K8O68_15205 [Salipaludibacillus sp. CUR1]|uniref:hypothetical protein n=1 Tax=Salipaludibacillus sp. CUR1 TaxID=2820003 RepID=UPI001E3B499E|nr:hypothetical protein [Salipaludibacillus sp. CUR1]MCE7793772.1 hypothetical protein [Salipaludibacillus sp. CUR1]